MGHVPGPGPGRGRRAGRERRAPGSQAHCQLWAPGVRAELCRLGAGRTRQGVAGGRMHQARRGEGPGKGMDMGANSADEVRVMHPNSRRRGCPRQARATCSLNSEDGHVM